MVMNTIMRKEVLAPVLILLRQINTIAHLRLIFWGYGLKPESECQTLPSL
jgi:hypothetical protein